MEGNTMISVSCEGFAFAIVVLLWSILLRARGTPTSILS
jgi:hypothetical protein